MVTKARRVAQEVMKQTDVAWAAFMAMSDEEQTEAIDRVLTEAGIFDDEDRLRPDWREILRKKGVVV